MPDAVLPEPGRTSSRFCCPPRPSSSARSALTCWSAGSPSPAQRSDVCQVMRAQPLPTAHAHSLVKPPGCSKPSSASHHTHLEQAELLVEQAAPSRQAVPPHLLMVALSQLQAGGQSMRSDCPTKFGSRSVMLGRRLCFVAEQLQVCGRCEWHPDLPPGGLAVAAAAVRRTPASAARPQSHAAAGTWRQPCLQCLHSACPAHTSAGQQQPMITVGFTKTHG